jgi:hypothetical protein
LYEETINAKENKFDFCFSKIVFCFSSICYLLVLGMSVALTLSKFLDIKCDIEFAEVGAQVSLRRLEKPFSWRVPGPFRKQVKNQAFSKIIFIRSAGEG